MSHLLAIDPGPTESGWCVIDTTDCFPVAFGKDPNTDLRRWLTDRLAYDALAVEMVESYGMAVGKDVFETCVWVGAFLESAAGDCDQIGRVYRTGVKLHHCQSRKAKDSNIIQALVDRFASGVPNKGKGTKAAPGWFYGFAGDVWQAYALAVCVADGGPESATMVPPSLHLRSAP